MAKVKPHRTRKGQITVSYACSTESERAHKRAMGEFDTIDVAEPAVKPKRGDTRSIKKAVRAYYRRDTLART